MFKILCSLLLLGSISHAETREEIREFQELLSKKTLSFEWTQFNRDYQLKIPGLSYQFKVSLCEQKKGVLENCVQKESKSVEIRNSQSDLIIFGQGKKKLADSIESLGFTAEDLKQLSNSRAVSESVVFIDVYNTLWTSGFSVKIASFKMTAIELITALKNNGRFEVKAIGKSKIAGSFEISLKDQVIPVKSKNPIFILPTAPAVKLVPQILPSAPRTLDCGIFDNEIEQTKCLAINAYVLAYQDLAVVTAAIPNGRTLHLKELFETVMMSHQRIPIEPPPDTSSDWTECPGRNAYEQGTSRGFRLQPSQYYPKIYFCNLGWSQMNGWDRFVDLPHYRAQTLVHEYSHAAYGMLGLFPLRADECIATVVEGEVTKHAYHKIILNGYVSSCRDLPAGLFSK